MGLWYHGFRVNELACLLPEDIILDHPYPHFSIIDNETRCAKNDPSRREVPIHHDYFRFLDKFPFSTDVRAGDRFSRYMKRRCGHSAHGIRHHIATRMRKARIEYSIAASILGHAAQGMTAQYGDILLEDKAEQLQKLY
jgi:integrase